MRQRTELAKLADQLAPYLIPIVSAQANAVGVSTGSIAVHALDGPYHTGTLAWSRVNKSGSSLADLQTRDYTALTNRAHVLASASGLGSDHTVTGLTAGHVLQASGATTALFAALDHADLTNVLPDQHHARQHNITDAGDHTVTGSSFDVIALTGTNTLGVRTPLADTTAGTLEALLKSDASGGLSLVYLDTPEVRDTAGSLLLNPTGDAVLPTSTIVKDLGDYNRKWRTLYAAELYVETLVAQDVISTIGGRVMVTPTSSLIAAISSGTGTSISMDVKHNGFTVGEWLYMAAAPGGLAQVEVYQITAGPTTITGGYRYTVNRNQDGSGQNAWQEGDAVASLGNAVGTGYIDLTATNTVYSHLGPTVTVYARTSTAAWTGVKPVTTMGNLRSFVDYGSDEYGFGLGNDLTLTASTGFSGMTADRTNGLRIFNAEIALYSGVTQQVRLNGTTGLDLRATTTGGWTTPSGITWSDTIGGTFLAGINYENTTDGTMTLYSTATGKNAYVSILTTRTGTTGYRAGIVLSNTATQGSTQFQGDVFEFYRSTGTPTFRVNAGGTLYTIWHAGNDGTGSGLDADFVDGRQSSSAGDRYDVVPFVDVAGVIDIGRYLDFHESDGDATDYSARIYSSGGALYTTTSLYVGGGGSPIFAAALTLAGASNVLYHVDRVNTSNNIAVFSSSDVLTWWNATYGNIMTLSRAGVLSLARSGASQYNLSIGSGYGINMTSGSQGFLYRSGGSLRLAVDATNVVALIDASSSNNLYAVIGSTTALYSARLSVYGNIHSNAAITAETYMQMATASAPAGVSGWIRLYFDGTNLRAVTAAGTYTITWS